MKTIQHQEPITKADLVIDPRIANMTKGLIPPDSYDYKEQRYPDYMKVVNLQRGLN